MAQSARARILVVDDNVAQMGALRDMLRQQDFHVDGFTSPAEALRFLQATRCELLLTDLMMPEMTGNELIAAAHSVDPDMAAVIMTGQGTIATAVEAMRSGALDYVLKPFKLHDILQVVDRVLEVRRLRLENSGLKQRLHQEARINKLTRIYALLSGINSAIIRIRDRGELFQEACRVAVEEGGLGIAWIDLLDAASADILPVAFACVEPGVAPATKLGLPISPAAQGLIRNAITTRKAVFSNDLQNEAVPGGPRRAEAIRRGYGSVIVLPLLEASQVVATMTLFARDAGYFNDDEVKLLTELAGDISFGLEYIHKEERLDYLAFYDPLTGLPNGKLFANRIGQRIAAARDQRQLFGILHLDIERFRLINDTLGRVRADELLCAVAARLKADLPGEALFAHASGNQFLVATRRAEAPESLVRTLEHVLDVVSALPFPIGGENLHLSMRAGVAVFPGDGSDAESLMRNAEAALLQAKEGGERYLFYARGMNARAAEQLKFESDLRRAVAAGAFTVYYQPRVRLRTRAIVGVEALLRWQHDGKPVSPATFIPVLEETGLILDVGRWVLQQAARDISSWRDAGLPSMRVAVNISAVQLRQRDFVAELATILAGAGECGRFIDIEVTESMLLEDIEDAIVKLRAMQALEVRVALDDFGTGYSSLNYLSRLPINALKIDRSFVQRMQGSPEQAAIVAAIVSLGRALKLEVVAEGVEQESEAAMLAAFQCDEAQGFLFSRPMPAADLQRLLGAGSAPRA